MGISPSEKEERVDTVLNEETAVIVLSENHIAQIINGEELFFEVDGKEIKVRQSYLKDIAADVLNREIRVMNTASNTFEYIASAT